MPLFGEEKRAYHRKWMQDRRAGYIAMFGGKCERCGSTEQLEFDHKDRTKKITHRVMSWAPERAKAELEKCQLLCHECHAKKSFTERYREREHGTALMYDRWGCRCRPCTTAGSSKRRLNKIRAALRNAA